jgi:hypothetical protein
MVFPDPKSKEPTFMEALRCWPGWGPCGAAAFACVMALGLGFMLLVKLV